MNTKETEKKIIPARYNRYRKSKIIEDREPFRTATLAVPHYLQLRLYALLTCTRVQRSRATVASGSIRDRQKKTKRCFCVTDARAPLMGPEVSVIRSRRFRQAVIVEINGQRGRETRQGALMSLVLHSLELWQDWLQSRQVWELIPR